VLGVGGPSGALMTCYLSRAGPGVASGAAWRSAIDDEWYAAGVQLAQSAIAASAYQLVTALQRRMVEAQEGLAGGERFSATTWLRDDGRHGGGNRWGIADSATFDRASVNVSQVHYDDEPAKRLASATALSTIIHPRHPHAPSVHVHVSWTEMRDARGYWRIMADLNPSIADGAFAAASAERFRAALRAAAGATYDHAARQGDRYFTIPALDRHRDLRNRFGSAPLSHADRR